MNQDSRLQLEDTLGEVVAKLCGSNPGSMTTCLRLMSEAPRIDPYIDGSMYLLMLDSFGVYESRIWMLYKDVCKESIEMMMFVLRATQLGVLSEDALNHGIDNYGDGINLGKIGLEVYKQLPDLNMTDGIKLLTETSSVEVKKKKDLKIRVGSIVEYTRGLFRARGMVYSISNTHSYDGSKIVLREICIRDADLMCFLYVYVGEIKSVIRY